MFSWFQSFQVPKLPVHQFCILRAFRHNTFCTVTSTTTVFGEWQGTGEGEENVVALTGSRMYFRRAHHHHHHRQKSPEHMAHSDYLHTKQRSGIQEQEWSYKMHQLEEAVKGEKLIKNTLSCFILAWRKMYESNYVLKQRTSDLETMY